MFNNLKLYELELSDKFITFYGRSHQDLLQFATFLYGRAPTEIKENNRKNFAHIKDDPLIFHPYGNPDIVGKDPYHHFHIIGGHENIDYVMYHAKRQKVDFSEIRTTNLEDTYLPDIDMKACKEQSDRLLDLWLEKRTATITELVDG